MTSPPRHIVCYSGGHSSALVAIEVVRKFGKHAVTLLNHDIHFSVEDVDVKRFKREIADYLDLPVTQADHKNATLDQFDVCVQAGAFKIENGIELCTNRLKTRPFMGWLERHHHERNCIVYYGYDDTKREMDRMQRRSSILAEQGYRSDFPLALWRDRTIQATEEIGIARPRGYSVFLHGNCVGCLKAGWQHWYIVFCTRPDIWLKAKWAEDEIGYAIHHDETGPVYLEDMEERFEAMRAAGVPATERIKHQTFWAQARKVVKIHQEAMQALPCDCAHEGAVA